MLSIFLLARTANLHKFGLMLLINTTLRFMSFRGVSRELPHESLVPLGEKSSESVPEMAYDLLLDFNIYSFCTCKKPAPHGSRLFHYSSFDEIEIFR